jgi:hypothetical protein
MICPKCQSEMVERVTAFQCPKFEDNLCEQPPICKGCFAAQDGPIPGIGEYFCSNDECPRTPTDNLRDLMNPAMHKYQISDLSDGETQKSLNSWVHDSFPEWSGPKGRALAVIEEATELAKEELGIEPLSLKYIGKKTSTVESGVWTGYMFLCEAYIGEPRVMEATKHNEIAWFHYENLFKTEPEYTFARMLATGRVESF